MPVSLRRAISKPRVRRSSSSKPGTVSAAGSIRFGPGSRKASMPEAGADLIESTQSHVLELGSDLGLTPTRILRRGWGFYGPDNQGRRRVRTGQTAFGEAARRLAREIDDYKLADERWDSAVARVDCQAVGRRLAAVGACGRDVRSGAPRTAGLLPGGSRGPVSARPRRSARIDRANPIRKALQPAIASSGFPMATTVFPAVLRTGSTRPSGCVTSSDG